MVSTEPRLIGVAGFEFKIFVRVFRVLLQDRYKPHAASTLCHISTGADYRLIYEGILRLPG